MAITIPEMDAVSSKYYDKALVQSVYESSPLLGILRDRKRVISGGTTARFPIRYRKLGQAAPVGPREQIAFQSEETRTSVDVPWSFYKATTLFHWDEETYNAGKPQIVKLMADKAKELKEDFDDQMATDIYVSNPNGKGIEILGNIISASSYGGVDESDFRSQVDSTTTEIKMYGRTASGPVQSIKYMIDQSTFGKSGPSHIITTRELKSEFESIWIKLNRIPPIADKRLLKLGFKNFEFHGVPVIGDYACPAKHLYGIDMEHLGCIFHTGDPHVSSWEDISITGRLHTAMKYMTWRGNLFTERRRTHFKFTALVASNAINPA